MKECKKSWETLIKQPHLAYFQFPLEYQTKNVQAKPHTSSTSPEGLQACRAYEKMLPHGAGMATSAIQPHSCPFFFKPTAEFLVNYRGNENHHLHHTAVIIHFTQCSIHPSPPSQERRSSSGVSWGRPSGRGKREEAGMVKAKGSSVSSDSEMPTQTSE